MSPALAYWMFFSVMSRAWSIPAPKPEQKPKDGE
jgi:hypothetical protein